MRNPLIVAAIQAVMEDQQEERIAEFRVYGRIVLLLDAIATLAAGFTGFKMKGSKSMLDYLENGSGTPKMKVDRGRMPKLG